MNYFKKITNISNKKKGRDVEFRCTVCGKYISYNDIPDNVKIDYIPDTEYTTELTSYTHLNCINKGEQNARNNA